MFDPELIVTEKRPNIYIAKVETTGMGHAVEPNARLIAAAPELLEALYSMEIAASLFRTAHTGEDFDQAEQQYKRAKEKTVAAIAKAKGE